MRPSTAAAHTMVSSTSATLIEDAHIYIECLTKNTDETTVEEIAVDDIISYSVWTGLIYNY